ncbi:MAG TPA: ATP-binding protein [Ideonella sp.]|nr:ATP-binding protein [Ideonella sp.]
MVKIFRGLRLNPHAGHPWTEDSALRTEVELAKIRIALKASPRILISGILGVLIVLLSASYDPTLGGFVFNWTKVAWASTCVLFLANGVYLRLRFSAGPQSDEVAMRTVKKVALNAMLIGIVWGSTSWLIIPAQSFQQDAIVLVSICMVLTGAAGSQAVYGPLVRSFAVTFTTIFAVGLISHGDVIYALLGMGYFAYCAATLHYCKNQEQAISTAIELSMRNEQLMKLQVVQRQQAEDAMVKAENARGDAEAALALAEKADRSKISFIAAVSHDLRQPMHALVQYVGHLKRLASDEQVTATVEKIDKSVEAMEDLMNAVLDFSKISMGSIKPRMDSFDIAALVRDIETQMKPMAQSKGLRLQVSAPPGYVYSDRVLLERIVRNITQNAVRYTETGTVRIRASRHAQFTRILVSDSGIGIHDHEKEKIFEEYYQVENVARDRSKGLGLGLAIVRDLSALLRHRISFKSIHGKGSTFAIAVTNTEPPVVISTPVQRSWQPRADDYVRGATVVLVDDDALARDGLEMTLKDFGCKVISAASGPAALEKLRTAPSAPQIVVSDYRLADGENGVAVIAGIRQLCHSLYGLENQLPAIVISGDTSPSEMRHVLEAELEMIHKPVSTERLYEAMNTRLLKLMHA